MDRKAIKNILLEQINELIDYKKKNANTMEARDYVSLHMQLASYLRDYSDMINDQLDS